MLWDALMLVLCEEPMRSKRSAEGTVEAEAEGTVEAEAGANRSVVGGFTDGGAGCMSENVLQFPKSPFPLDAEAKQTNKALINSL